MSLEPEDIRYKEFRRSVRGYSPDEVDDLLDSLADELEESRSERDRLSGELQESQRRVEEYEGLEGSIRATLTQAEKAAADYREAARRDAEATLESARREAGQELQVAQETSRRMLADASYKVGRVQESYEALRQTRHSFDADLRRLLQRYAELLDEASSETSREIEAPLEDRLDREAISAARDAAEHDRTAAEEPAVEEDGGPDASAENETDAPESSVDETGQTPDEEAPNGEPEDAGQDEEEPRRGRFLRRRG